MSPMPKKRHLEGDVKADVKKLLDDHGWFWFSPPANQYGKSGISDRLAVKHGMFMAIETKRGKNKPKPTANQIAFLQSVKSHNHFAFVVNEARVPVFEGFLTALNRAQAAAQRKEKVADADGATMLNAVREMQQEI